MPPTEPPVCFNSTALQLLGGNVSQIRDANKERGVPFRSCLFIAMQVRWYCGTNGASI